MTAPGRRMRQWSERTWKLQARRPDEQCWATICAFDSDQAAKQALRIAPRDGCSYRAIAPDGEVIGRRHPDLTWTR